MGVPSTGAIILVPFPFSDLSNSRIRPAICVASAGRGDWIVCQVTSQPFGDLRAVQLFNSDLQTGAFRVDSYARPGKLFTMNASLMTGFIGNLKPETHDKIVGAILSILRPNKP